MRYNGCNNYITLKQHFGPYIIYYNIINGNYFISSCRIKTIYLLYILCLSYYYSKNKQKDRSLFFLKTELNATSSCLQLRVWKFVLTKFKSETQSARVLYIPFFDHSNVEIIILKILILYKCHFFVS